MHTIEQARYAIRAAKNVAFLTGAGLSAASGIPTFRGDGGYWRNRRFEELATPSFFLEDPVEQWAWYTMRRRTCITAEPNAGHRAIHNFQQMTGARVVTQNVDGLHERVGTQVTQFHGSLWRNKCSRCLVSRSDTTLDDYVTCPLCPQCGGPERVDVVWFGEAIPVEAFLAAEDAFGDCDALVVVGTSGIVMPAAQYAYMAQNRGVAVIEVNPQPALAGAIQLAMPAAEALPLVLGE
jgi:NAD-dependent deacetylase